ncbi:RICIN domain-containing protein [Streptomyces sp. NPDC001537]
MHRPREVPAHPVAGHGRGASTADGVAVIQYTCNGAANQMFTLSPVTALGNSKDYRLVAVHSVKWVDVSETCPRSWRRHGLSSRPRSTGRQIARSVHRRGEYGVRGRADLPRAVQLRGIGGPV